MTLSSHTSPDEAPAPWPDGVTARFLTRGGLLTRDRNATVDIHDEAPAPGARSTAICSPCGWSRRHDLTLRTAVLKWAQEHADQCTALAQPTS